RTVRERLVLGTLLPDHQDFCRAVEPSAEEHRPVLPAKRLTAQGRLAQAAVVRGLGEQLRPATGARRARIMLPGVPPYVGHAAPIPPRPGWCIRPPIRTAPCPAQRWRGHA